MSQETTTLIAKIAAWLIRWRWLLLLASIVATAVGVRPAMQLRFDASIETLFTRDDPLVQAYLESIRLFGGDEIVVVAYRDPELLTVAGLERNAELAARLKEADPVAVRDVSCLATGPRPSAPLSTTSLLEQIRAKPVPPEDLAKELTESELHRDILIGADGETTALVLALPPRTQAAQDMQPRSHTIRALKEVVDSHPLKPVMAGGPVLVNEAVLYLDQDGRTFLIMTTGLLVVVIGVLFRSVRWVIAPLIIVHVTLIWTKALLVLWQAQLTMISSILTAMITVIGIATVIHATVRFRECRRTLGARDALHRTLIDVGPACFWTSATTAAGFGALMICEIAPVRNFGLMMSLGSLLVWFVPAFMLPGLVLLPWLGGDPADAPGEEMLSRRLQGILNRVQRHPRAVTAVTLLVVIALLGGIPRLGVETDFSRNFRSSSPVVTASRFIEQGLSGTGILEISFTMPDKPDADELERLRELQSRLRELPNISKVMGLLDVLDFLDGPESGGPDVLTSVYGAIVKRIPFENKIQLLDWRRPGLVNSFWNRDEHRMRILLRAPERATSEVKNAIIQSAADTAREVLGREATVSGHYVLLTRLVDSLLYDQRNTFALAAASCLAMLAVAFRNWRLALIAMVPNAFPILMVVGAMGWFGLPVNMATAMLSAVSIGMAVDSSIHYIYHFQRERQSGVDFDTALASTHHTVGRALVFANLAIVVGFSSLTLSNFIPTIHFGILVSIALLGGLAGNLFLLPLLMQVVLRPKSATHP